MDHLTVAFCEEHKGDVRKLHKYKELVYRPITWEEFLAIEVMEE